MACSCSRQIAAGEHLRHGEILLLFGFAPCECVNESVDDLRRRAELYDGTAIEKAYAVPDVMSWVRMELEVGTWILGGRGHALFVGTQSLSIPNQFWRRFASTNNIRCTNIAVNELGFECTDALGNVTSAGRRLHLRHVNHTPTDMLGRKLAKAWVHVSASQSWKRIATACVFMDSGEMHEWA